MSININWPLLILDANQGTVWSIWIARMSVLIIYFACYIRFAKLRHAKHIPILSRPFIKQYNEKYNGVAFVPASTPWGLAGEPKMFVPAADRVMRLLTTPVYVFICFVLFRSLYVSIDIL